METSKRLVKTLGAGDAAVEGLLNGILAGVVMALLVLVVELLAGVAPLIVLGYFDLNGAASPLVGLFTHVAVSGMYGVVFGMIAMFIARIVGARTFFVLWLMLGALYGLLVFGIAEWIILPRTLSPLRELPVWAFASAHLVYGAVLGWLTCRKK